MVVMPFILSLSRSQTSENPSAPGNTDLVMGSGYVLFTGEQMRIDAGNNSNHSQDLYSPRILWHNGKTYFTYCDYDQVLPFGQVRIHVFDERKGFDRPYVVGDVGLQVETHYTPVIAIDDNKIYIIQENPHDTPLNVYRSGDNLDYNTFTLPFTIGAELSYSHIIKKNDGNYAILNRGVKPSPGTHWSGHVTEASAGMETWGSQLRITTKPTPGTARHYPFLPFGRHKANGFFYLILSFRDDDSGVNEWFYRHYCLKTPDSGPDSLRVFSNIEGTYTHDYDVSGVMTDAVLATNFTFMTMDVNDLAYNGLTPRACVGADGRFYCLIRKSDGSSIFYLKYWTGSAWVQNQINIADVMAVSGNVMPFNYLTVYAHDNIWMVVMIDVLGDNRPHWFKTSDQGVTWLDLGDMLPEEPAISVNGVLVPNNLLDIPVNRNFPIYFSETDLVSTGRARMYCKVAAFGTVQAIPEDPIIAASVMNYNSQGIFHYKCVDADMVNTGNNVDELIDKFGVAGNMISGASKPQWNGVDRVTVDAATSQRFNLTPVTPISTLNSLVFFCVAKKVAATNSILLSLTDTTHASEQITFFLGTTEGNIIALTYHFTATRRSYGQDDVDDGLDHLFTFVLHRNKYELYVDGKLQYYANNYTSLGDTNLASWQNIGKGPASIVTINSVKIGMRALTASTFQTTEFLEMALIGGNIPIDELHARNRKLCDDNGITYQDQFQVPA